MLFEALLVGLAALYVWYLIAESTLLERPLAWPRERWPLLIGCPWCAGFWITLIILLCRNGFDGYSLTTHLAAAAVTGYLGSQRG